MSNKVSLNETLLNLIIYIQDTKRQTISKGILLKNNVDWYKLTQDVYNEIGNDVFDKAGIAQNIYNFIKILDYSVSDTILNTEYKELNKFLF